MAEPQPSQPRGLGTGTLEQLAPDPAYASGYGTVTITRMELAQAAPANEKPAREPMVLPPPPAPTPPAPPASAGMGGGGFGYGAAMGGSAPMASSSAGFQDRLQTIITHVGRGFPAGALLIRTSEMEGGAQLELEEDMAIMAHILQKAIEETGGNSPGRAMGVDLMFTPGGDTMRDFYLEGYGVVFMLKVPFPLIAVAGGVESGGRDAAVGSEWEKARRELIGQPLDGSLPGATYEPYREEVVQRLKQVLLEALKNAHHLRGLKPEDAVTVCVLGAPGMRPGSPAPTVRAMPTRTLRGPGTTRLVSATIRKEDATVLTIQVTKADAESFAKGKLDLDGFRKRAKISTYGATAGEAGAGFGSGAGGFGGSAK